jgi:hypothetical protein
MNKNIKIIKMKFINEMCFSIRNILPPAYFRGVSFQFVLIRGGAHCQ